MSAKRYPLKKKKRREHSQQEKGTGQTRKKKFGFGNPWQKESNSGKAGTPVAMNGETNSGGRQGWGGGKVNRM